MAVKAEMHYFDDFLGLLLQPDAPVSRVREEPEGWDPRIPIWFYWDEDKLIDRDEWECLGVEVLALHALTEAHLAALGALDLPRVDLSQAGLADVTIAEALRWAKRTHGGREAVA